MDWPPNLGGLFASECQLSKPLSCLLQGEDFGLGGAVDGHRGAGGGLEIASLGIHAVRDLAAGSLAGVEELRLGHGGDDGEVGFALGFRFHHKRGAGRIAGSLPRDQVVAVIVANHS